MPKPLTASERKKLNQSAQDITQASKQSGKGIAVNQTPTFQAITKKGTKIRIARAFSKAVSSGEIQGVRMSGRTKANHVLYSATGGGAGGTAAEGDTSKAPAKKGFWARLFGG